MAKDLFISVSLQANISDLEAKFKQAKKDADDIGKAMKQAFYAGSGSAVGLANAYEKANAEAARLSAELKQQKALAASFGEFNIRPFKDIDADIAKAEQAYQTLKNSGELSMQALAQAKLKLHDRIQDLKGQTNGWTESLYNAKAGLAAVAASFAAIGGAIKQAVDMEALTAKLKYATGSAEGAANALKFTGDMASRLGIDAQAAAQGFSGIAAAARGSALEGQKARDIFESIATASRVVGLTSDQMGGALLAVQQMMSKGVVSAEEFRGQLGERLPGATRIAADALGVTEAQFAKMLDTGQIVASDFLPKFSSAMMTAFGPEAQSAGESTAAQFARLTNHARDMAISLGSILLPAVNAVAGALSAAVKWVAEFAQAHPALTALAVVGGTLAASWSTLTGVVLALRVGMTGMLANVMALPAAFAGATTAANALKAAIVPLIVAFTAGFEFGTWLNGFSVVQKAGVFMVSTLMQAFEQLRWSWESFAAIFTGDTIDQANARHIQRLQEIRSITAQMYSDSATQSSASADSREQDESRVAAAAVASAEQQKAAYAGLNTIIEQQLAARMAAIQTYYATLLAESNAADLGEGAKRAAETQLFIADYTERLDAMVDYYGQAEALLNHDAETRMAGIRAGSAAERAAAAEIMEEKRKLYAQAQQSFAAHVEALNKEYYRHLDAVRDIEQQKLDFMQGAEAALRDIKMQGMTEYERYSENIKEIDRLESEARQALKDGDIKKAQEYANEAINLAKSQTSAVVSGDVEMVSSAQARYTAQEKITRIMADMAAGMDAAKAAEQQRAGQVRQAWEDSKRQLEGAQSTLADITGKLAQTHALTISSNATDVQQQINALTRPTSSTHTINVRRVEQNATGGLVGASIRRFASGGMVPSRFAERVQKFATGGPVFNRPGWLKVPGSGNGDTEPAALDAGSYVIKKSASAYYGDGIMNRIARGVQKFATGGPVSYRSSKPKTLEESLKIRDEYEEEEDKDSEWMKKKRFVEAAARASLSAARRTSTGYLMPMVRSSGIDWNLFDAARDGDSGAQSQVNALVEKWDMAARAASIALSSRFRASSVWSDSKRWQDFATGGVVNPEAIPVSDGPENEWTKKRRIVEAAVNAALAAARSAPAGKLKQQAPMTNINWGWFDAASRGDRGAQSQVDALVKKWVRIAREASGALSARFKKASAASGFDALRAFATGGDVAGTDTVPAMLTPGEWVVKKSAVGKYGLGFLDALNNMRIPKAALSGIGAPPVARFATGGLVGGSTSPAASGDADRTVTIRFAGPTGAGPSGTFRRSDVQSMLDVLKSAGARAI